MDSKNKLINKIKLTTGVDFRLIGNNFSILNYFLILGYFVFIILMLNAASAGNFVWAFLSMLVSVGCGFFGFMRLIVWDKK